MPPAAPSSWMLGGEPSSVTVTERVALLLSESPARSLSASVAVTVIAKLPAPYESKLNDPTALATLVVSKIVVPFFVICTCREPIPEPASLTFQPKTWVCDGVSVPCEPLRMMDGGVRSSSATATLREALLESESPDQSLSPSVALMVIWYVPGP